MARERDSEDRGVNRVTATQEGEELMVRLRERFAESVADRAAASHPRNMTARRPGNRTHPRNSAELETLSSLSVAAEGGDADGEAHRGHCRWSVGLRGPTRFPRGARGGHTRHVNVRHEPCRSSVRGSTLSAELKLVQSSSRVRDPAPGSPWDDDPYGSRPDRPRAASHQGEPRMSTQLTDPSLDEVTMSSVWMEVGAP
ncbi:hypothetical protein GCM10009579_05280 [Streptomyces javensis]|uniref:HTH lysR-type domain-containing protein n=1 Tax=Streptomyces javensis TaxID=114698 RepID=A0ABP4H4X2_9ACTN